MDREDTLDRLIKELTDVKARLRHLELAEPETPSCLLTRKSAWACPSSGVYQFLPFDSEIRDRSGLHESVTNPQRITLLHGGLYAVFGCILFESNDTGRRGIGISHNASWVARHGHQAIGDGRRLTIATMVFASAGDYFRLSCQQSSGGDLDVLQQADSPFFSVFKVVGG